MLSVKESHKILNANPEEGTFTLDEAKVIRDFLTEMADLSFDAFSQQQPKFIPHEQPQPSRKDCITLCKS